MPRKPTTRAFVRVSDRLRPISPPKKLTSQSRTKPRAVLSRSLKTNRIGLAMMRKMTITPRTMAAIVITRDNVSIEGSFHRQELACVSKRKRDILCSDSFPRAKEIQNARSMKSEASGIGIHRKTENVKRSALPGRVRDLTRPIFAIGRKGQGLAMRIRICYTK